MTVDVTVVVPVWNPGPYIEPLIESLLGQTWPAERLEFLFVDDGATDDTPARLDRLAEQHDQVRVIHQENSGWPGKPRNVGTEAARGTYVFYVDQDDHLRPRSIERMLDVGMPNDADVIIGKVSSDFRGVPHGVFRETRPRCTVRDAQLIDSLTPHKMFRREFLAKHGIRYPEGPRRLEDQLFMVQSYFAAEVVSIVGDYPCYFYKRRPDAKNAGSAAIDPKVYYTNLREILDVVVGATEPGEFRDLQLRRFYRVEMLGRLSEPAVLTYDDDYRQAIFAEVSGIARDYMTAGVTRGLVGVQRARARLLEAGDVPGLLDLARAAKPVHAWSSFDGITQDGATWTLTLRAELLDGTDAPVRLVRSGSAWRLVTTGDDPLDVELTQADVDAAFADVVIRERDTHVEWFVPHTMAASVRQDGDSARLEFGGTATLDPATLAGGSPLPRGSWDVAVRIHALGTVHRSRFGAVRSSGATLDRLTPAVTSDLLVVLPYLTQPAGNFSLDVGEHRKPISREAARLGVVAGSDGSTLSLTVPFVAAYDAPGADAAWTVVVGTGTKELARRPGQPATDASGRMTIACDLPQLPGRSGWVALLTRPDAPPWVLGRWRRARGRVRVKTDEESRVRGAEERRGLRGPKHRLRQELRRAVRPWRARRG